VAGSFVTGDLDKFLSTDDFATSATFHALGTSASTTISGIFTDATKEVNQLTGAFEDKNPEFLTKTSDVSTGSHVSYIYISSVKYYVRSYNHDGTGMTTMVLSKEANHG